MPITPVTASLTVRPNGNRVYVNASVPVYYDSGLTVQVPTPLRISTDQTWYVLDRTTVNLTFTGIGGAVLLQRSITATAGSTNDFLLPAAGFVTQNTYNYNETTRNPHPATAGVLASLRRGVRSVCMQVVGDSTGTDDDEWFGIFGQRLGKDFPAYTVQWRQWGDPQTGGSTTLGQEYNMPYSLQVGTGNGGGERGALMASGGYKYPLTNTGYTGDQDVRVKLAPTGGWVNGGAAAIRTIASRYSTSGANRAWVLYLGVDGKLNWLWSSNGTADAGTVTSTVAVPFSGSAAGWVRCVHDVDNGAAGHDVLFYTSTDGVNWTQLGTTVTTATATTIAATTGTDVYAGSRNATASDFLNGTIYWVEYRPGPLTNVTNWSVVAPLLDDWDQYTTSLSCTMVGAPVLMLLCGDVSGTSTIYFDDSTRRPKLFAPHGQAALFINTSHNEGNFARFSWVSIINTALTNIKALVTYTGNRFPIILVGQNPSNTPIDQRQTDIRAARGAALMQYAATQAGVYGFDAWPYFEKADIGFLVEPSDGVHPTQGDLVYGSSGSDAWGKAAYNTFFGQF